MTTIRPPSKADRIRAALPPHAYDLLDWLTEAEYAMDLADAEGWLYCPEPNCVEHFQREDGYQYDAASDVFCSAECAGTAEIEAARNRADDVASEREVA